MSDRPLKNIHVAVFVHLRENRKPMITAYTRWFNPSWSGYNGIDVQAKNGTEAKKIAIAEIKARLADGRDVQISGQDEILKKGTLKCPDCKSPFHWEQLQGMRMLREKQVNGKSIMVLTAKCPESGREYLVKGDQP